MTKRASVELLYDKLEIQRRQLFELLNTYHAEDLKINEAEGKWSVNQVLVHLISSEEGTIRYIRKKTQAPELIGNKTIMTTIRSILLKWMLGAPFKYKMPKVLKVPANDLVYEVLKERYQSVREELKALIEELSDELLDKEVFRHPFAGRFSMSETLKFFNNHIAHHEKQINRILRSLDEKEK